MRLEPIGNPIEEKAGEVLAQLEAVRRSYPIVGDNLLMDAEDFHLTTSDHGHDVVRTPIPGGTRIEVVEGKGIWNAYRWVQSFISDETIWNGDGIYTISCSVRASFPGTPTATGRLSFDVREKGSPSVKQVAQLRGEFGDTGGKWVRVVSTIDLRGVTDYDRSLLNIQAAHAPILSQGAVIEVRDFKIERGPDTDRFLPQAHTHTLEDIGLRIDTAVGTRIFVGDTMIYGDTGWRDITNLLRTAPTQGGIWVRRTQDSVWVRVHDIKWEPLPDDRNIITLPSGFRPTNGTTPMYINGPVVWDVWVGGQVLAWSIKEAGVSRGENTFYTSSAWPTTLPGTPA